MSIISKIQQQLKIVDSIPCNFHPEQTVIGIDRGLLEDMIYEYENNELYNKTKSEYEKEFESFSETLKEYIDAHRKEISEISWIQYTDEASVKAIMGVIGSKGILNTENGLNVFRDTEMFIPKNDWIMIKANGAFSHICDYEKKSYDAFLSIFL